MRPKTPFLFVSLVILALAVSPAHGDARPWDLASHDLADTPVWTNELSQAQAFYGGSLSSGDFNGDGYTDLVVAATHYDSWAGGEGVVIVYYGTSTGFSTSAGWSVFGTYGDEYLGTAVASADVNGDAYADLVIGSPNYGSDLYPGTRRGRVQVFLGTASGLRSSADRLYDGSPGGSCFGCAIANTGDLNGDGTDEIIIGSPEYDDGTNYNAGRADVYAGSPDTYVATPVWSVVGGTKGEGLGRAVTGLGDVNGDGQPDVTISAPYYDDGSVSDVGRISVYYGDGTSLASSAGWTFIGARASQTSGWSVAAGDINGDGIPDLVAGCRGYAAPETYEGAVLVFNGTPDGLAAMPSWQFESDQASAYLGTAVSVGDYNGDGFADIMAGASHYDGDLVDEGVAVAFLGSADGPAAGHTWRREGDSGSSQFGAAVHIVSALNGGAGGGVLIGAPTYRDRGKAYLYASSVDCTPPAGPPVISTTASADVCEGSTGAAVTVEDSGGGRTTHQWGYRLVSGGPITDLLDQHAAIYVLDSVDFAGPGEYLLVCTSTPYCGTSAVSNELPVRVFANPEAVITASGPTTFSAGESVILTASAAAAYVWSTGATSQSITVTTSGDYTVTVTDANGCSTTSDPTRVVVNPAPPIVTASGATTFCEGGSVTLTAPDGYSYLWSTGETSQAIVAAATGEYTVTVTDAYGGSSTSAPTSVTVHINPAAPTVTTSGSTTFCEGGTVTLTAPAGYDYAWSNGAATQSITVASSGDFSVTVTDGNGCSATSAATTVVVNPKPAAPVVAASGPTTFCEGGSVTLTAPAGYLYAWSNGAATQSITVATSGDYSVTVTDEKGCSATSAATTVTVNALPDATITSTASAMCKNGIVTLTATEGASYLWSTGATTQSIDVFSAATYSVTVTGANGCSRTSEPLTLADNTTVVTITPDKAVACPGDTIRLTSTVTGGTALAYQWYGFGGLLIEGATEPHLDLPPGSSGNFFLHVNDSAGCEVSSNTYVYEESQPEATITVMGPTAFCEGGSVTLTANDGVSWLWSNGATTQWITATTAGTYNVTVTNADGCSATSDPIEVTVYANPPTPVVSASGPTTFCEGGSVTLSAPAGYAYTWSTGATTQSILVTGSGDYVVTVTDANGCSATSAAASVSVNARPPTPTIVASSATTFCQGENVTLAAPDGYTYLWSTGATTQSITVSESGDYVVTVTDANGCSASSAATTVTVQPLPAASMVASGPTTFCAGGSVTLTASAGSSYLWSTGASTQSITVTESGDYSVVVTDTNGCSASSVPVPVVVNANPETPAIVSSGPTAFCEGGSVTLSAPEGYAYLWSTGATTQSITVTASGSFSVTVTDANGCAATSGATSVTVSPATEISQQPQSKTIPKNTSTTLDVVASGTGTPTYQWYRGASGSTSSPISGATSATLNTGRLTKGTYDFWVRVSAGCGTVDSTTATVIAQ